ncbi:phage tail protein [Dyella sp.]|uniref:phage tail protein n=1 Tax=Dyella sp. TaxID=1869338 RepID=UPI002ED1F33C
MSGQAGLSDAFFPVAFQFTVSLGAVPTGIDSSFQEVSGLEQTMDVEELREGGENRFVHQLPKGVQQKKLMLKRGVTALSSPLIAWCKATLEGGLTMPIVLMPLTISLLDGSGLPVRIWLYNNAYPVRWDIDAFNSTKNEVAVETIELAYQYAQRML